MIHAENARQAALMIRGLAYALTIHHYVADLYLRACTAETTWCEDSCLESNGTQYTMVVGAVAVASTSNQWRRYFNVTLDLRQDHFEGGNFLFQIF